VVYKTVIDDRAKKRHGKLHARYPQARDGSTVEYTVLIKDSKSREVVLTADCTLPNTPEAVAGLYRAFLLTEPAAYGGSTAASASRSNRRAAPPGNPSHDEQPILLPGLTVVGYRNSESGYQNNWASTNYGWGSYGDTYSAPIEYPDWWYETDEGNDELDTYCHTTNCSVRLPEYNERVDLGLKIGDIKTAGICGQAKTLAQNFLDNDQVKLWNGEVRDNAGFLILGDYLPRVLPALPEIHLSAQDGMSASTIAHEAIHALGKSHGYTESFPDGVTRVFGAKSSQDTMGNYCG